jgi:hypothetical protein
VGCDFAQNPPTSWADQHWEFPYGDSSHPYNTQIKSDFLGLCLVGRAGTSAVVATTCGSWQDQWWTVWISTDGTYYQFQNAANPSVCLAARSGATQAITAGCDFLQNPPASWADQHWTVH